MTHTSYTLDDCHALDAQDPLAPMRDHFNLPDGMIYLDGNSLGAQPKSAVSRMEKLLTTEWGQDLIKSWNTAGWVTLPQTIGRKIAPLIGAGPDNVVTADSTSINIFKCVAAACAKIQTKDPKRRKILSEPGNFPTDLYMLEGLTGFMKGEFELVTKPRDQLVDAIDHETACVLLTHVHYVTAEMWDMKKVTEAAHAKGAMMVWDLSHSVGAVPVDLDGANADFALGCGYKYLNGGPGAPAFVYVNSRHLQDLNQPLSGWFAHKRPFDFTDHFESAGDIRMMQVGTPVVSAASLLDEALNLWQDMDMAEIRKKSLALTDLFRNLMEDHLANYGFTCVTPENQSVRGSHITYKHKEGYAIMQALIDHQVVGDFRAPDHLRFGVTPLYVGYADIFHAVMTLKDIMEQETYKKSCYQTRHAVT